MTLGSRKGIFSFCSFCFAVAIPLCSVIVWLAQLTLTPLVVGTLFVLSILTQVKYSVPQKRGLVAYWLTVFLFTGGLEIVGTGYYLQAIVECFRAPSSTPPASLADPFVSSLIPGALAGLLFVHNRFAREGFCRLTLGFLLIISSVDFFRSILGYSPYSEFLVSILFNVVGAPFAAFIIFFGLRVLEWVNCGVFRAPKRAKRSRGAGFVLHSTRPPAVEGSLDLQCLEFAI
jgi:hypothetical protein